MDQKTLIHSGRATDFLEDPKQYRLRRFLEALPAVLSWGTLVGALVGSFLFPKYVALFIIAFDVYFIINGIYFAAFLIRNTRRMKRSMRKDWLAELNALPKGDYRVESVSRWEDVIHLVIFPFYTESVEVLRSTMDALKDSHYPLDQIWVVLAGEERAGEAAKQVAATIQEEYGDVFGKFITTAHPKDVPGELAGKGSNQSYAMKRVVPKLFDAQGISYERVLVSSFDSDSRVYPHYFGCLTWHFLTAKRPQRSSYQPIPLYNNNIWEAPLLSRLPAVGSTAWQLFMQSQPNMMETFSSHSMPLRALVDVGYWNTKLVSEDSIIFWQCFLQYDGEYDMVSLYYPISMDANVAKTLRQTAANIYKQYRRWAYGIEKIAFVGHAFRENKKISLTSKVRRMGKMLVGFWNWGTSSFLLLSLGWLPVAVGGEAFRQSVLAFNLPRWTSALMRIAMIGLLVNGVLTFILMPPRPKGTSRWVYLSIGLQWLFLPFSVILFGAVPALDAQTKMFRQKYLGFWVTEKVRKGKYQTGELTDGTRVYDPETHA